jgi:hypothetical protein
MLSKNGRLKAGELVSVLVNKYPGLKLQSGGIGESSVSVNYGGTTMWPTTYQIKCTMDESTLRTQEVMKGVYRTTGDNNTIVTSIVSVTEMSVEESDKKSGK